MEEEQNNIEIINNSESEEEEEEEDDVEELKDVFNPNSSSQEGKKYRLTKVDIDLPLLENLSANTTEQKRLINKIIRKNSKAPQKLTKFFDFQGFPKSKYFTDDEIKKILFLVYKNHKSEEEIIQINKFFLKTKVTERLKSDLLNGKLR